MLLKFVVLGLRGGRCSIHVDPGESIATLAAMIKLHRDDLLHGIDAEDLNIMMAGENSMWLPLTSDETAEMDEGEVPTLVQAALLCGTALHFDWGITQELAFQKLPYPQKSDPIHVLVIPPRWQVRRPTKIIVPGLGLIGPQVLEKAKRVLAERCQRH